MPEPCEKCKANPVDIARNTQGTPTAKLIAILVAHGITNAADLAEIVGISDRAVRKARNSRTGTPVPTGTTGPELQDRPGTPVPKTELQDRNSSSASRADNIINITNTPTRKKTTNTPLIPQAPKRASAQRGSRLARDWHLPDDWRMWAKTIFPAASDFQIDDQAAQFLDYWTAKPGAQACKLDWEATWRNWCRKGLSAAGSVRKPHATGVYATQRRRSFTEMFDEHGNERRAS